MRKDEVIASVQRLTIGLGHLADSLEEQDSTGLYVYADMISRSAYELEQAAHALDSYATGAYQLHRAAKDARNGGRL